jgi:hypothetical protein
MSIVFSFNTAEKFFFIVTLPLCLLFLGQNIDQNGEQEDDALDGSLVVRRDTHDAHALVDDAHQRRTDNDARNLAHAAICGADGELCRGLMECVTADGCIELLETAGLRDTVLQSITNAVQLHLDRRVNGDYTVGAVIFSNIYGQFGTTDTAKEMIQKWYDS